MIQVLIVKIVHDLPDVEHGPMVWRGELETERPLGGQHEPVHLHVVDLVVLAEILTPRHLSKTSSESGASERPRRNDALGRARAPDHDQAGQQADAAQDHGVAVAEHLADEHDDHRNHDHDLTDLFQVGSMVVHSTLTHWVKPSRGCISQ